MNKQNKFYSWLLGEGEFPFYKDLPVVDMPEIEETTLEDNNKIYD